MPVLRDPPRVVISRAYGDLVNILFLSILLCILISLRKHKYLLTVTPTAAKKSNIGEGSSRNGGVNHCLTKGEYYYVQTQGFLLRAIGRSERWDVGSGCGSTKMKMRDTLNAARRRKMAKKRGILCSPSQRG